MPFLVPDSSSQREHSAASDRELLERLRGGDERALDELVERKARPLLQLARRILGDSEEARDVVQLTFIRAWQNREKFNRRWSPNTWLYRIATNLAIDRCGPEPPGTVPPGPCAATSFGSSKGARRPTWRGSDIVRWFGSCASWPPA